ncbi:LysR family transcriptional regulator [Bradyrhizobium manausense]
MTKLEIDLRLLRCFEALVDERHVTRAAERMEMSQSGMSTALARLRAVFDDPILVRTSQGMTLSDRAPEIVGCVRRALREIDLALLGGPRFEPGAADMAFTIMASDYVGRLFLPEILARLRDQAPGITLTVAAPQPNRIRQALTNSEIDLVVGFFHDLSDGLLQMTITTETLICLVRTDHPSIGESISLEEYAAQDHLAYASPPTFISSLEVMLNRATQAAGVERCIRAHVPSLSMMPGIVEATDMIATIPSGFARSFVGSGKLRVLPVPFVSEQLPVRAIWHERMDSNAAHRWLRRLVQSVGKLVLDATGVAPSGVSREDPGAATG